VCFDKYLPMLRRIWLPLYRPEYWANSLSSKTLAHSYRTTRRRKPITAVWAFKTVKTWDLTLKYLLFYKKFLQISFWTKNRIFYYTSQVDSLTLHRLQLRLPQITSPLTQFFNKGKHNFADCPGCTAQIFRKRPGLCKLSRCKLFR